MLQVACARISDRGALAAAGGVPRVQSRRGPSLGW